jgi:NitT/TauT family transport system substrate-binding protein
MQASLRIWEKKSGLLPLAAAAAVLMMSLGAVRAADLDFGKMGSPVHLVVGYQPYGTENLDAVVMRAKELWKKYLPPGSTVDMQVALQGSLIVNAMLAGKQHIGHMGDMPSVIATTKEKVADVRIVGVNSVDPMCQYLLVRKDAPAFKSAKEGFQWLNGKVLAAPRGSCADRFMQVVLQKEGIKPDAYLNQSNEIIVSNFRAGKLDAAVTWEPYIGKMISDDLVRILVNGEPYNESNVTFVVMRADLIKQRPDVVKAWLNAELDTHLFLRDPKNQQEIVDLFVAANPGFPKDVFWSTLYGTYPGEEGRSKARLTFAFTFTPEVLDIVRKDVEFLKGMKAINVDKLRPEAIMPQFTQEILQERGLTSPVGIVHALPESPYAKR